MKKEEVPMRDKRKLLIVLCLTVALVFSFSSCGKKSEDSASSAGKAVTFSGELVNALADKIVVKSSDDMLEFVTNDDTAYDLGDEVELTVGDMVNVEYHEDGSDKVADHVTVTKAVDMKHYFSGTVNDINDDDVTVDGKNLTVHFLKDKDTEVKGKLTKGDEVKVEYTGDISKHPYAEVIEVTKEKEEPEKHTLDGNVAELENKTVLVSIQSAKAYRFNIADSTKITGKADNLKVGYDVEVTYTGDIDRVPDAITIEVMSTADSAVKEISGTVDSVKDGSFILKTKTSSYSFATDSSTKYTGEKIKAGRLATVSYVGKLGNDERAVGVYTVIPKKDDSSKNKDKEKGKKKKEPMPDPKPKPQPKPKPSPKPVVDPKITTKGSIVTVDNKNLKIQDDNDNAITLKIDKNSKIASGYIPAEGDIVKVIYNKNKMLLIEIQLIERPVDPDDPDNPDNPDDPNNQGDDQSNQ